MFAEASLGYLHRAHIPKVTEFKDITDLNVKYTGMFLWGLLRYGI